MSASRPQGWPLSDSHWGGQSLKGGLVAAIATLALAAGVIGLFAWSPWVQRTESDWLGAYEAWSDGIGTSLGSS